LLLFDPILHFAATTVEHLINRSRLKTGCVGEPSGKACGSK
jgi:hypothetical protein